MIREGKLWARNTVIHRQGFTEICQNLDKAVEFLCLMCEELSSMISCVVSLIIYSLMKYVYLNKDTNNILYNLLSEMFHCVL